jgi:hypothetical protein
VGWHGWFGGGAKKEQQKGEPIDVASRQIYRDEMKEERRSGFKSATSGLMFLHSDRRAFEVRMDFTIISQSFKQLEYPARCTASEAEHVT